MKTFYERGKKYNCKVKNIPYFRKSVTINGKVHQVYGDGEKDALKKIAELKSLSDKGVDIDSKRMKLGEAFRYWLYDIKRVDKDIKASSFARYEMSYRIYIKEDTITNTLLYKLNSVALQRYVTDLYEIKKLSGANIKAVVKVWKMFTKWALEEGYILKDPCKTLSIPGEYNKNRRKIEIFTEEERATILKYMEKTQYQYDTLIILAFSTGMRLGELLALRWGDIQDDGIHIQRSTSIVQHIDKEGNSERYREVWDTKTLNAVRTIPILQKTKDLLKYHHLKQMEFFLANGLGKPEYVFTTTNGQLIEPSSLRRSYSRMLTRAGVPHRKFHAIRHTFATEAIRRGVDVKDLQMLMGHADLQTTYIYVQSDDKSKRNAIEKIGAIM